MCRCIVIAPHDIELPFDWKAYVITFHKQINDWKKIITILELHKNILAKILQNNQESIKVWGIQKQSSGLCQWTPRPVNAMNRLVAWQPEKIHCRCYQGSQRRMFLFQQCKIS